MGRFRDPIMEKARWGSVAMHSNPIPATVSSLYFSVFVFPSVKWDDSNNTCLNGSLLRIKK